MPRLYIDLPKIEHNARLVAGLLKPHGVRLVGVTKACLGNELVAEAMLSGGAGALADSRQENIANLRRHLPSAELELMRPPLGERNLASGADLYFVSSLAQAKALLEHGAALPLRLCLQVETGDGREGIPWGAAAEEAARLAGLDGAALSGLATTAACARPQALPLKALETFSRAVEKASLACSVPTEAPAGGTTAVGRPFQIVSAGGSGLLRLLVDPDESGKASTLFDFLTELRCGEAILLGRIPSGEEPDLFLPGAHRDAFVLEGRILEIFRKKGRRQALVDTGVQDIGAGRITPLQDGTRPIAATSDYLVVELKGGSNDGASSAIGDRISFVLDYYALLAAMASPFVDKAYKG